MTSIILSALALSFFSFAAAQVFIIAQPYAVRQR
jgi:hypothetical protein